MEYVVLLGLVLILFGILGIVGGVIYILFDMARKRDWAYFFPVLFGVCAFGGLFLIAIAASALK